MRRTHARTPEGRRPGVDHVNGIARFVPRLVAHVAGKRSQVGRLAGGVEERAPSAACGGRSAVPPAPAPPTGSAARARRGARMSTRASGMPRAPLPVPQRYVFRSSAPCCASDARSPSRKSGCASSMSAGGRSLSVSTDRSTAPCSVTTHWTWWRGVVTRVSRPKWDTMVEMRRPPTVAVDLRQRKLRPSGAALAPLTKDS